MNIEEICQELDKALLEYLNLINLYQSRRKRTGFLANNGYLELAHSKYVMGPNKISKYQYDRRMQATTRVDVSLNKEEKLLLSGDDEFNIKNYKFTLLENIKPEKEDAQSDEAYSEEYNTNSPNNTGFRQRSKLPTPIGQKSIFEEELEEEAKQAEVDDDKDDKYLKGNANGAPIPMSTFTSVAPSRLDPVNWFGVLVPSSLKNSQSNFQQFLLESMGLINIRAQLIDLEERIVNLQLQKSNFNNNN